MIKQTDSSIDSPRNSNSEETLTTYNKSAWVFSGIMMFLTFGGLSVVQYSTLLFEHDLNFSKAWIGTLLMCSSLMSIALPFLLQIIGKWVKNPNIILTVLLFIASISVAILPFASNPWVALLVYCILGLAKFGTSNMQITNALSITKSKGHSSFLMMRSIGTLGFAVFCLVSMILSDYLKLPQMYWLFAGAYFLGGIASLFNQSVIPKQKEFVPLKTVWNWFKKGPTLTLLVLISLSNLTAFIGASFLGNFVINEMGGTHKEVSIAWSIATFLELPFFAICIWILKRFGLKKLILFGLVTNALRLLLTAYSNELWSFYAAQSLHGIFYAATLSGFSIYLNQRYKSDQIHHLQLFSSFIYAGFGSSIAGKLGAFIWDYSDLRFTYFSMGILAIFVSTYFLFIKLDEPEPSSSF